MVLIESGRAGLVVSAVFLTQSEQDSKEGETNEVRQDEIDGWRGSAWLGCELFFPSSCLGAQMLTMIINRINYQN